MSKIQKKNNNNFMPEKQKKQASDFTIIFLVSKSLIFIFCVFQMSKRKTPITLLDLNKDCFIYTISFLSGMCHWYNLRSVCKKYKNWSLDVQWIIVLKPRVLYNNQLHLLSVYLTEIQFLDCRNRVDEHELNFITIFFRSLKTLKLQDLRRLRFEKISQDAQKMFQNLDNFKVGIKVDIYDDIQDVTLPKYIISLLSNLKKLELHNYRIYPNDLSVLSNCDQLENLTLKTIQFIFEYDDAGFIVFGSPINIPTLQRLEIKSCFVNFDKESYYHIINYICRGFVNLNLLYLEHSFFNLQNATTLIDYCPKLKTFIIENHIGMCRKSLGLKVILYHLPSLCHFAFTDEFQKYLDNDQMNGFSKIDVQEFYTLVPDLKFRSCVTVYRKKI